MPILEFLKFILNCGFVRIIRVKGVKVGDFFTWRGGKRVENGCGTLSFELNIGIPFFFLILIIHTFRMIFKWNWFIHPSKHFSLLGHHCYSSRCWWNKLKTDFVTDSVGLNWKNTELHSNQRNRKIKFPAHKISDGICCLDHAFLGGRAWSKSPFAINDNMSVDSGKPRQRLIEWSDRGLSIEGERYILLASLRMIFGEKRVLEKVGGIREIIVEAGTILRWCLMDFCQHINIYYDWKSMMHVFICNTIRVNKHSIINFDEN